MRPAAASARVAALMIAVAFETGVEVRQAHGYGYVEVVQKKQGGSNACEKSSDCSRYAEQRSTIIANV